MSDTKGSLENELLHAELLSLVAAGRPEQLARVALAQLPAPAQVELASVTETFASLAFDAPPAPPSPALRDRILASARATISKRSGKAIIVLDMLNDHLEEGGPLEVPRARGIVPAMRALLERARHDGTPVVYVVDEHDPDDADLDVWRAHNVRGSHGAEVWPELAPLPGDTIVPKPTYSGFVGSKLGDVLAELRVDTLVITGCLTEIGIHATAVDALQRGFAVEVPPHTQAGVNEATEQGTLTLLSVLQPYGQARAELLRRIQA